MTKKQNDFEIVVYTWDAGAFINGLCSDFDRYMKGLIVQYGPPNHAGRSSMNAPKYDENHHDEYPCDEQSQWERENL